MVICSFIFGSHPSTGFRGLSSALKGSLEDLEGVLAGPLEAVLGGLPVNNVPDVLDIGRLAILVLRECQLRTGRMSSLGIVLPGGNTHAPTCRHQR